MNRETVRCLLMYALPHEPARMKKRTTSADIARFFSRPPMPVLFNALVASSRSVLPKAHDFNAVSKTTKTAAQKKPLNAGWQ
jgi:hypothetical protein